MIFWNMPENLFHSFLPHIFNNTDTDGVKRKKTPAGGFPAGVEFASIFVGLLLISNELKVANPYIP